jgi:hypothetical protein
MKDRLTLCGIILLAFYIGLYIWDQKEKVALLDGIVIESRATLKKQRELIDAQREYINFLEVDSYNPLYQSKRPIYKDPI